MTVIVLKDITTETDSSVETLLEVLSDHIDTLADASHYFVVDPTDTTIMTASLIGVSKYCMVHKLYSQEDVERVKGIVVWSSVHIEAF